MLWPEYVRRQGTFCVSSVSFGAFSLTLAHYMCVSTVTEEPVSMSSVTGVLYTLIVHTYGFTMSMCCVLVLYNVSLHRSASVRLSGFFNIRYKLDICKVIAFIAFITNFYPTQRI